MRRGTLIALALSAAAACRRPAAEAPVTVVTTPDVAATGIVRMLGDRFQQENKAGVNVIVTEERFVSDLARRRVADVVVTRSPALREALQKRGAVLEETIGYDDYLLVGPRSDPAHARGAKNAAEALRRIARRDRAFCSPVDVPELREREALLWNASPAEPADNKRYAICRGSAKDVLAQASRRGAYTLTDRSTFTAVRGGTKLVPLLEGTPLLHNDVTIVLLPDAPKNAEWFMQWTMSYRGRDLIERYRYGDEQRFFVDDK